MTEEAKVVPLKAVRCPSCGKPGKAEHRPFCSVRCANLDLGRWLNEDYRIQSEEEPDLDANPLDEE